MINLTSLFRDLNITVDDNGGNSAPTVHLAGLDGCAHILVKDWEELHGSVMALLDGLITPAAPQAPADAPAPAAPAAPAPADPTPAAAQ